MLCVSEGHFIRFPQEISENLVKGPIPSLELSESEELRSLEPYSIGLTSSLVLETRGRTPDFEMSGSEKLLYSALANLFVQKLYGTGRS